MTLCQQLGIKGDNLRNELIERLKELPKIYTDSINGIEELNDAIKLYTEFTNNSSLLPILKHLIKKSNTTVYEFIHKEAPIRIEENPIQLNLTEYDNNNGNNSNNNSDDDNGIDFGNSSDDNGNTTTTNSAEIIDFGDLNSNEDIQLDTTGDIDWGDTDTVATPAEEIDFDVPIEEYDIVIEGDGMDGGIAKGEQAYTILDSPPYRDKFIDELYELESFLKLRHYELNVLETSTNIMVALLDTFSSTYDAASIDKMLKKSIN